MMSVAAWEANEGDATILFDELLTSDTSECAFGCHWKLKKNVTVGNPESENEKITPTSNKVCDNWCVSRPR